MDEASTVLRGHLVEAYPEFVRIQTESFGFDLEGPIGVGTAWLEEELAAELELPYRQQRRGPLEIFQAALAFPTDALLQLGSAPVERDDVTTAALPGDLFNLAPASSQEIGEMVWASHLAWGATKAMAFLNPPSKP